MLTEAGFDRGMTRRAPRFRDLSLGAAVFVGVFAAALGVLGQARLEAFDLGQRERPRVHTARSRPDQPAPALFAPSPDQHFRGCDAARAAGRVNIPASDPSYRTFMDGDGDGLACEPWR